MDDSHRWTTTDWSSYAHETEVSARTLRYVDYGEGPVLLLIHGMGGSWQTWLANIPALGEEYRVIAVDLPGFGGSDPLVRGSTFEGYVAALEGLLDALHVRGVAVFGHSLGGLVALSLAAQAPHRVRCVVLVSGGGAELAPLRLALIQAAFRGFRSVVALPGVARLIAKPRVGRLLLWPAVHNARALAPELVREVIPRQIGSGYGDAVRLGGQGLHALRLERVSSPVLLTWGRNDRILPLAVAEKLNSRLEASCLVVFDEVGHCAMFEAPTRFNRLALDFLGLQRFDREETPLRRAPAWAWLAGAPRAQASDDEVGGASAG